jgi:hypothetical protein
MNLSMRIPWKRLAQIPVARLAPALLVRALPKTDE